MRRPRVSMPESLDAAFGMTGIIPSIRTNDTYLLLNF
jgi:hypothetical protein